MRLKLEPKLPRRTLEFWQRPVRALMRWLAATTASEPGQLYRRVRSAQFLLPLVIVLVVVAYQFYVVRPASAGPFAFWLELIFYAVIGPLVTYFVLGWIGVEVTTRERAERNLRGLYTELSESNRQLAAVAKLSKQVGEASELETLLESAAQNLVDGVGANAGVLVLVGGLSRSVGAVPENVFTDLENQSAQAFETKPEPDGRFRLSHPLRWGERLLGMAHLYFAARPNPESLRLFEILVGELPAAIEASEHRTRDLLTVFEVDRSIRAEPNLERLLEAIVSRIRERVAAEAAGVYLADDDGRLRLAWGRNVAGEPTKNAALPVGDLARSVAQTRQALQRNSQELKDDALLFGARTAIGLPLLSDTELIGVIVLGQIDADEFDPRDLPLLRLLANQVALAVRNARAYLYGEELAISEERSRIAREIHDGIAQSLAFTALKLDLAGKLVERDPARVRSELETARETLREQIREVRRSIFALRPIELEKLGFIETLRQYVRDFGEQNNNKMNLEILGEPKLSPADEAVLFRILQESLNNVAKHARANQVWVKLVCNDAHTQISVRDDGRGFDPANLTGRVTSAGGLGLQQMRERIGARGGKFEFKSAVDAGTEIVASLG